MEFLNQRIRVQNVFKISGKVQKKIIFKDIIQAHNGTCWTEGPYEKFQFYVLLPMQNLFFVRIFVRQ